MKEFVFDNVRFELLNDEIIHIEKATSTGFSNENTLFVPEKTNLTRSEFFVQDNGDYITLFMNEYYLVYFKGRGVKEIKVYDKYGSTLYSYRKIPNSGELPLPFKTPAIFPLFDSPRVTLPIDGYSIKSFEKNEKLKVENKAIDLYLLLAKGQADALRRLYVTLTGRSELVRFKTLGFWNSRYYKYNEESAKNMILAHDEHNIPLDNMVIDTDWRKANDIGIGYDIDTDLFPDMSRFFDFAHKHNVEIMFNDHPEPVKGAKHVFEKEEVAFREEKLQGILNMGLDYWWYDRNWSTHLISPTKKIKQETFGDYLFADITKHEFQKEARSSKVYKRPIIMCNVNNVINGTYEKIYDSASHRFSIQWTGDIQSSLDSLGREVKNLIKGSLNEVTYINSDIGGHVGNPSKEEYLRWMQFATFSPIFRVHATNSVIRYREPWNYDEETLNISRKYLNLRYRLLPLLYTKCADNYFTGEPVFKALSYNYSNLRCKNDYSDYLFANKILVSPFLFPESKAIKRSVYQGKVKVSYFNNTNFEGEPVLIKEYDEVNLNLMDKAPEEGVNVYDFTARYEFKIKFDSDTKLIVNSDDGCSAYVNGVLVHEDSSSHAVSPADIGNFKKDETYDIRLDYYQYGGGARLYLTTLPVSRSLKKAYLPTDEWIDLFTGKVYKKASLVRKDEANLLEMPLFIRGGSIIPLVKEKNRANRLDYSKLTLDFYPSFVNKDETSLYEDDKKTTAYKYGNYRYTYFETSYNKEDNAIYVKISNANGEFINNVKERNIIFKYNLIRGLDKVKEVTINGERVDFIINKIDKKLMPLSYGKKSNIFNTLSFEFKENIYEEYVIKFAF